MNFNTLLNQVLGAVGQGGGQQGNTLLKIGGGVVAAKMLGGLMKKGGGGGLVKAGSMAALGALAYHAYQNWQKNQAHTPQAATQLNAAAFTPTGAQAEAAGRVILRAMIAAAAANGHIDADEQRLIEQEGGDDAEIRQWLQAETARPATPAELARDVGGNAALAAETYLAARLVCATPDRKEMLFLSQLAQALQLDAALVDALEQQARS